MTVIFDTGYNVAMLWLDSSDRTFEEKLSDAKAYYVAKYEEDPTYCCVILELFNKLKGDQDVDRLEICGLEVTGDQYLLKYDMHIGVNK
jgi:hypothetical protein